jgi:hypothetical protein
VKRRKIRRGGRGRRRMGRGEEREKEGRKNWGNNQVSVH